MKLSGRAILASGIYISPLPLSAAPMGILVPAYFYPTSEEGNFWSRLNSAALGHVPVTAIMNPGSGPGDVKDPTYQAAVSALTGAGGQVIGYVHTRVTPTSLTLIDLSTVEMAVDKYALWYGEQGLSGIFVDEMRSDVDSMAGDAYPGKTVREYYQAIYTYITDSYPGYRVIGNPGVSGGGVQSYLQSLPAADTLVTFEDKEGYETAGRPDWVDSYPASSFANIPYNIPTAAGMDHAVRLARSRNAGYVYVTDDGPDENAWDRLPRYWDQEVQLVKSINDATLPTELVLSKAPDEAASLFVSGNPDTYEVQVSNDLATWTTVHTEVSASGGFTWMDSASSSLARRFYRTAP
jgi:hypothetical protein